MLPAMQLSNRQTLEGRKNTRTACMPAIDNELSTYLLPHNLLLDTTIDFISSQAVEIVTTQTRQNKDQHFTFQLEMHGKA